MYSYKAATHLERMLQILLDRDLLREGASLSRAGGLRRSPDLGVRVLAQEDALVEVANSEHVDLVRVVDGLAVRVVRPDVENPSQILHLAFEHLGEKADLVECVNVRQFQTLAAVLQGDKNWQIILQMAGTLDSCAELCINFS